MANRVHKSLMNAKIGFIFYFISIFLAFFSRRIFLDNLGNQFMGLTGTLGSILGFLNISEVGIGTCIGYFLYKPLEEGDKNKICEITSLFGWLYRFVGSFILLAGIILSLFFPYIFAKEEMPLSIIYFTFFSFLFSNLISYFINYRQIILDSDQKTYKISVWTQTGNVIKTITQIYLAYSYKNLYLWVLVEFVFSLIVCWILNYVIIHEYPWLKTDKNNGKNILKKYPEILIKAKQIFIHRIKNSILSKCDEIFIFTFESLEMVTFYGNYNMIIGKLTALFNNVFTGMNASIGNLVAEGDKNNIKKIFWEFLTFRYWTTGIITIVLVFLFNTIITWWLGDEYILANHLIILMIINMYIMLTRPSIDLFINAYGLYDDLWAAYAEGIINLVITICVGYFYGLIGILLGKTISLLLIVVIWKPYYLYSKGFCESVRQYWKNIFTQITILLLCLYINYYLSNIVHWGKTATVENISLYITCITIPVIIIYSVLTYFFSTGSKDLVNRIHYRQKSD